MNFSIQSFWREEDEDFYAEACGSGEKVVVS
jgi:hypothetical protein